jgi:glycosyltransferase involved in cell wall biosynthesis
VTTTNSLVYSDHEFVVQQEPEVSVIMASMNEAEAISKCIDKVKKVFSDYQINGEIVVADNSSDETPEIARAAGATVVTPDKLGYGYALMFGIEHSRGRYIILGDADGTYDYSDIPRFLGFLHNNEADLVIGSRLKGDIRRGAMPWLHQYIGNPLLTWALNRALGTRVSDAHCGLRAFARDAWFKMDLALIAQDLCSEMLVQMAWNKTRIEEIPITYYPREGNSKAKAGTLLHGWRCFSFLAWRLLLKRWRQ